LHVRCYATSIAVFKIVQISLRGNLSIWRTEAATSSG
jgi:hypothetical protein